MSKVKCAFAFGVLTLMLAGVSFQARAFEPAQPQAAPPLICMRDDSSPRMIRINTDDGSFRYENCDFGMVLMGRGSIVIVNQTLVLTASGVSATYNISTAAGSASVQEFNGSPSTISDSDTANSVCMCPM